MLFRSLPSDIKYNGVSLKQVQETRYVVFLLDFKLSWKAHNDLVSGKVSRGVVMLRCLSNVLPLKVLMSLYHTLIASYINYGCLIWASNFQSNYRRVQVQQNKAIRILGNYDRGSASTVSIYKKFDILDVGKIKDMQIGI